MSAKMLGSSYAVTIRPVSMGSPVCNNGHRCTAVVAAVAKVPVHSPKIRQTGALKTRGCLATVTNQNRNPGWILLSLQDLISPLDLSTQNINQGTYVRSL